MPVVIEMEWDGVTPDQYDQVRGVVGWETDDPRGGFFHVVSFDDGRLKVTDVWETAEDFQAFVDQRLMPGVQRVGLAGEPRVVIRPAHRIYSPHLSPKARS